jgi:hypothetical protein
MLLAGAASSQTLQFRYTFADTGTTTTTNDQATSAIWPVPLKMVAGDNKTAINRHGALGSGVQGQGYCLDLSTNSIAGNSNGCYAFTTNNATLGQLGIFSNFTMSVWLKMPALQTNLLNQGARVFELMSNGITDIGGSNSLGFQYGMGSGGATFPKNSMVALVSSAAKVTPPVYYDFPTNVWLFFAMSYDSVLGDVCVYYGTEASPAKLYAVRRIGAGTNFNFSGSASIALGNRVSGGRSFPGWIDDARFYTGTATASFIENIRQSATPLVVSGLVPDGSVLMSGTNTLTFTATSANGVASSGVKVMVNGADVSSGLSFTPTTGGQIVTYANLPADPMLTVQTNLNGVKVAIRVTDGGGIVTTNQYVYDAFSPNKYFVWEAEDYDFSSGQYTNVPTYAFNSESNLYYTGYGTPGIDYNDNGNGTGSAQSQVYRNVSDLVATEYSLGAGANGGLSLGELMRPQVLAGYAADSSFREVDVCNNDGLSTLSGNPVPGTPNTLNYTRDFPAGVYNAYVRASQGGTGAETLSLITSGQGTYTQTTTNLGSFSEANSGGWESFSWIPLKDSFGNLVQLNLSGVTTLQASAGDATHTGGGAGGNLNFFMLVPANTNLPIITAVYPNGTNLFQPTAALTFTASSPAGFSISTNSISVRLIATNLVGQVVTNTISSTNGLTFSGSATSWNVSCPLAANDQYKAVISVVDANGSPASSTVSFDTLNPVFTWEAEDYNFSEGQFIDNPQPGAYAGMTGAAGIDYYSDSGTAPSTNDPGPYYRSDGISTQPSGDKPRLVYLNSGVTDYYVGWFDSGNWCEYTRTFPAGTFNVFLRAANGSTATGGATLSQVTGGWGTSNQTLVGLGGFSFAPTGGWQTYADVPLQDANGNLAQVTLGGTNTFRLTSAGNINVNFLMLFPANPNLPVVTNVFPNGSSIYETTNTLSFKVTSPIGVATNNIVVTLNGAALAGQTISGSSTNWTVTYPHLLPNMAYALTVTVTDASGNVIVSKSIFDTFSPNNYTWEAEDFDYDGGQFFDNPQTNAYAGVLSITNVDLFNNDQQSGLHWTTYRPNGQETEVNGDVVRPQYNGTGYTDYSVGYFHTNEWLNYTRHYPAGTYNVYGRMATSGGGTSYASLSAVTGGWGTASQTTNTLGMFTITTNATWETYSFYQLANASGSPVAVTFSGETNTLQVFRPSGADVNVNYFMLVPVFAIRATQSGGNAVISFPAQAGFNYQVEYKTNITDATWISLGSARPGFNGTMSVNDPATAGTRFYRVQVF